MITRKMKTKSDRQKIGEPWNTSQKKDKSRDSHDQVHQNTSSSREQSREGF